VNSFSSDAETMGICKQNNAGILRVYQTELKIPGNIENSNWLISHKAQGLRYMPIPFGIWK